MEGQIESVGLLLLAAGNISCSVESCEDVVSAEVDSRLFCLNHFLSDSFQELQARHKRLLQKPDAAAAAAFKEFLAEWTRQAEDLADDARFADQQMKTRLQDVLAWISSTGKSLQAKPPHGHCSARLAAPRGSTPNVGRRYLDLHAEPPRGRFRMPASG